MMASDEPTVLTPSAFSCSPSGALKSFATMLTARLSISPRAGYSSLCRSRISRVGQSSKGRLGERAGGDSHINEVFVKV